MKKFWHRAIIAIALTLCMMFSFVACSDGREEEPTPAVAVTGITISQSSLDIKINESSTLSALVTPRAAASSAKISWKSSDSGVATVSSDGVVKGLKAGTAKIRASAGDYSDYCLVTVSERVSIGATGIAFTSSSVSLKLGETDTAQLEITVLPAGTEPGTITWSITDTDIATVDADGLVTAVSSGMTIAKATMGGLSASCIIYVYDASGELQEQSKGLYVKKVDSLEGKKGSFIMGMDASEVISLENAGVEYKDFDGNVKDVFEILAENGITDIRIRIWNDPYVTGHSGEEEYGYGGGNCNAEKAIAIAKRCAQYGLGVIIDFHYSDFWADPAKQYVPKAWSGYTVAQKVTAIHDFTYNTLDDILTQTAAANSGNAVKITMVQVGNETTGKGICGETDWSNKAKLYNAGSQAIREINTAKGTSTKVALHFTNPEKTSTMEGFAASLKSNNVDYDVFGSSYYPYYHGTIDSLAVLNTIKNSYNKEVMVLETAYGWTDEDFDETGVTNSAMYNGYPITVQGQANSVRDIIEYVSDLGGLGVCYWGGTWVAPALTRDETIELCQTHGCGWAHTGTDYAGGYDSDAKSGAGGVVVDNEAFWNSSTMMPIESLKVFNLVFTGQSADLYADYIYSSEDYYTVEVGSIELPSTVRVILNDGTSVTTAVVWDVTSEYLAEKINEVGAWEIYGTTMLYGGITTFTAWVMNENMLVNGSFEDDTGKADGAQGSGILTTAPSSWTLNVSRQPSKSIGVYVGNFNAEMGDNSFHFWSEDSYSFTLSQNVQVTAGGTYGARADLLSATDPEVSMYIEITYGSGTVLATSDTIKGAGWAAWYQMCILSDIEIPAGVTEITYTVHVTCAVDAWGNVDNLQFYEA